MAIETFGLGDIVQTKKPHPCGCDQWKILRIGVDVKLQCLRCERVVVLERVIFKKKAKIVQRATVSEEDSLSAYWYDT